MKLIAAGREADVYLVDDERVLRRNRGGRSAVEEGTRIRALHAAGYPVPRVGSVDGPDIVMERVTGPTLSEALLSGSATAADAARLLARLHDDLHAIPWPDGPLIHLDLHPENVLLGPGGPVVIDWANARPGPAGLDVAMTLLILAQVVVTPGMLAAGATLAPAIRADVLEVISTLAATVSTPAAPFVDDAVAQRRLDPNLSAAEDSYLGQAADLLRELA
ncbi:phosphotransferase [Antribacter gilvus]|uniref:phosphotransferase n=1 Tax=Antribacter gilvus TaxID=2304675 RepID=UPI000F7B4971|nr:phosphotransferase [Antribacter gilvus]